MGKIEKRGKMKKIIITIILSTFLIFCFLLHIQKITSLESEISDFENKIDDLEYKNNDLEYRIDDIEYKLNM